MSLERNAVRNSMAFEMRESQVPSSRLSRMWQYGGLAASMAFGAAGEGLRRATGSTAGSDGSLMLSAGNMERLVAKLSKMRGAALKLGQMMSFQGEGRPSYQSYRILMFSQIPRCFPSPFMMYSSVYRIALIICLPISATRS